MPSATVAAPAHLLVRVAARDADLVSGLLWIDGPQGIEERPDGEDVLLVAGFGSHHDAEVAAAHLAERASDAVPGVEVVAADDESWRDAWRPHARPVRVGSLLVVPVGPDDADPPAGDDGTNVLAIDAGRAFTGGSHPTTRLMLAEVELAELELALAGLDAPTVLDVGCGSGVLAAAAARLGARSVTAIDVDPAALDATRANAARNGVAETVDVRSTPLADLDRQYDLVVANLLHSTIVELAPALTARVAPEGRLVLSGLLSHQWVDAVFHLGRWYAEAVTSEDGWVAVRLSR